LIASLPAAFLVILPLLLILARLLKFLPCNNEDAIARLTEDLDRILPQTQCRQCGFDGCEPYARAIAKGTVAVNLCAPGGSATAQGIARILGREPATITDKEAHDADPQIAVIDAARCIGCVKCIRACPVDAILGAAKQVHAVLPGLCTGCGLCLPPCPVDCISLSASPRINRHFGWTKPGRLRSPRPSA
jgi:electron transport complex protein RnfB